MPCYHPIRGWLGRDGKFTTNSKKTWIDKREEVQIACGQCLGCKLEYSRQWAIRCQHEMRFHYENSFITLTYDDEHLPKKGVNKKDCQDFIKRLRYHVENDKDYQERLINYRARDSNPLVEAGIRYFLSSEYGDKTLRPHYHAIIFGYTPNDLVLYNQGGSGCKVYLSQSLSEIWGKGNVLVGESCNFETAAYIARYVVKNFEQKELMNGIFFKVFSKNFVLSSRRPALGYRYFEKNLEQLKRLDKVLIREGLRVNPARYYDRKMKELDSVAFDKIKDKRKSLIKEESESIFYHRMENKEQITEQKIFKERGF